MLTSSRVVYLIVYVRDLARSRSFYEAQLGLRVLEEDADSVKYDGGSLILCLNRAADYGVELPEGWDESAQVVFLVRDVDALQAALEQRGVAFPGVMKYSVGAVADFYDPDGHHLVLYEPSEEALGWPSGATVRAVWAARGSGRSTPIGPAAAAEPDAGAAGPGENTGLNGKPLIYLFMFEDDAQRAFDFYQGTLGLRAVERVHCCNQACPGEVEGIVKYDAGGILLSTHHLHGSNVVVDDFGQPYSPREYNPDHARGIAPVFAVADAERAVAGLTGRNVPIQRHAPAVGGGWHARLEDPFGHPFYVREGAAGAPPRPVVARPEPAAAG